MEISNIKQLKNGNVEVTFCDESDFTDFMNLTLTQENMWQLSDYCRDVLSFGAQIKRDKTFKHGK